MVKMVKLMNTELTPEGWESKAIGDISNIHRGMSWNADNVTDRPDMGIPVLRIPNVQNKLSLDDLKYLSDISEQDKVRYRVSQGYSIMVGSNGNKDRVGNCCYIEQDMEFVFASFLLACSAKEGNDNKYLFYLLTSYPIQGAISSDAATSTGLHNIGLKFIRKREVLIPPFPEQRKIAEILSTVDETIEKTDAIIQETQQLKKGLMRKLFTEGIGHTRFKETKVGRIPEAWKAIQIGEFSKIRRGASPRPIGDAKYFAENGRGWVRIADVTSSSKKLQKTLQYLSELGASRSVSVNPGDLIMSICATIGKPIIVDMKACIHDGFILFSQFHGAASTDYIYYLLQLLEGSFVAKGQEGTQKNLNTNLVRKTYVPLPPLDEQHKIAEIISETDAKIEKEKAFKSELEQLKKGLMQVLLTGKVRVKV